MSRLARSPEDRLRARLSYDPDTGCINWTGGLLCSGYGSLKVGDRIVRAHRFAFELEKGPIPPGLVIDHLCRNRRCCNPDHLEAVTPQINTLRGEGVAAKHAAKTHCPKGHPYDAENTYRAPSGGRMCRRCIAARWDRYHDTINANRRAKYHATR